MVYDLKHKRVLVIGAKGGIGGATAAAFEAAGAEVERPSRESLDVLDEAKVAAYFEAQAPFDHVVVAAAFTKSGPVADLGLADAQAAMDSKFFGAYRIARHAKISENGSLTLISGFLSDRPSASSVLQGSINAALEALARGLALEQAPIRVNAVSPGLIDTQDWRGPATEARQAMFANAAQRLPVRRVGKPEDVAEAILLVATNPYMTGSTVTVDGGGTIA